MATTLHMFIEVDYAVTKETPFSSTDDVRAFNQGELFVWRSSPLFHLLGYASGAQAIEPLFKPRGLPPNLSEAVYYRFFHIVDEDGYQDCSGDNPSSHIIALPSVSDKLAQDWIDNGWSYYAPNGKNAYGRDARKRVSDPNWRFASHLTRIELIQVMERMSAVTNDTSVELLATIAAMGSFDSHFNGPRTRVVYWFES